MKYSPHALQRMEQRGIDSILVELAMMFGVEQYDHDGCIFVSLQDRKKRYSLAKVLRRLAESVERENPVFVVQSTDGSIVTTGRQYKRHRRH